MTTATKSRLLYDDAYYAVRSAHVGLLVAKKATPGQPHAQIPPHYWTFWHFSRIEHIAELALAEKRYQHANRYPHRPPPQLERQAA